MEELELLKKDWKKQTVKQPKLSYKDIDKMILKRSSSLVKWIFYVSLIEFGIGIAIVLLVFLAQPEAFENSGMPVWLDWFGYASTLVVFYFMYRFFINYKKINATNSIKELMQNIMTTRKTVKHYIVYSLSVIAFSASIAIPTGFIHGAGGMEKFTAEANFSEYLVLAALTIFVTSIIVAVCYFVYYLLYGLLTRKLKRNYKELKQLKS